VIFGNELCCDESIAKIHGIMKQVAVGGSLIGVLFFEASTMFFQRLILDGKLEGLGLLGFSSRLANLKIPHIGPH
jgi:hypothetical protein